MNKRQMKKALKQAQGRGEPRRLRWLPANHPERTKWWNRRVDAMFRFFCTAYPWDGHEWALEEFGRLIAEENLGGTSHDMSVEDESHFDPWRPVYYSGDARRQAYAEDLAEDLRLGLDDCPF